MKQTKMRSSTVTDPSKETNKNGNAKPRMTSRNAARERSRVRSLRSAFQALQDSLPSVPRHTKLSKLDVLVLAATYIAHLSRALHSDQSPHQQHPAYLHPVRKWPMRCRLYAGACVDLGCESISSSVDDIPQMNQTENVFSFQQNYL